MSQPVTKLRVVTPSVDEKPSPKLRYGFEELIVTCRDYSPLLKQCVKEVGPPRAKCPLDFDWRQAFQANAAGLLLVLAARVDDDDDSLVGFCINVIGKPIKYSTTLHAQVDMMYLHPAWRRGWAAINMLKANELRMRQIGVKRLLAAEPTRFKNHTGLRLRQLFKFMGYHPVEIVWEKYLED